MFRFASFHTVSGCQNHSGPVTAMLHARFFFFCRTFGPRSSTEELIVGYQRKFIGSAVQLLVECLYYPEGPSFQ